MNLKTEQQKVMNPKNREKKRTQLQRHRNKDDIKQSNNYIKYKWTNYSNQETGLDKKQDPITCCLGDPL